MNEAHEIEITLEELKAKVKLAEQLEKLERNSAFKAVILEGFLKDNMLKMATLTTSPAENVAKAAMNAVKAKGVVESFLGNIFREGEAAKASLEAYEEARLEALGAQE